MPRVAVVLLAVVVAACSAEPVAFSPLLKSPPEGGWDILVRGFTHIRSTELAPGARPARPVLGEKSGTKKAHFIATYAGEVTPEEVGTTILETFREAPFLQGAPTVKSDASNGFKAWIEYATESVDGVLEFRIRPTDQPHRLDVFYTVREEAK
jgi:hypothetical protein